MPTRKLRIDPSNGTHAQGKPWPALVQALDTLHTDDGVRFVPHVDELSRDRSPITEPWVGVVHEIPEPPPGINSADALSRSLPWCRGLWVVSEEAQIRLEALRLPAPISRLYETADDLPTALANSAVYRALPVPRSQAGEFRTFDLTVFIISYKRLQNIGPLLESLCAQDFQGTFEVILWNNNSEVSAELDLIVAPFRSRLEITVLHSSRNYYCIVRLAVAHLMRSERLMICDDDIQPTSHYLTTFVNGLESAGEKAVVCARGNTFRPHRMNGEAPHRVWEHWEHLDFWEVNAPPREVHFMHGSSCLMPRAALLALSQLELPRESFILVDDYWLSYALSGLLGWKIWKIQATNAFRFDKSAEDPAVALYLNPRVLEERTNFYVYHMTQGWPAGCSA